LIHGVRITTCTSPGAELNVRGMGVWNVRTESTLTVTDAPASTESASGEILKQRAVTGAFVRTAALDSSLKTWSYQHGADTRFASPIEWTDAKEEQWEPDGACARSAREQ
jgi:hypothetical protein